MSTVFTRGERFVFEQGRPLDRARLRFHFASGPARAVLDELAAYQNDDGGFGHALEPDLRTPVSSAVATWCAATVLHEVGAGAGEPLVRRMVGYLLDTYDAAGHRWWIVPPQTEDAPRAPWWAYADIGATFGGCLLNPTAGLAGALWEYQELVPRAMLAALTEAVLGRLEAGAESTLDRGDLTAAELFVQAGKLPDGARLRAVTALRRAAARLVENRPQAWTEYLLQPLDVAHTPDSPLSSAVDQSSIAANLDYLVGLQLPDGSWPLTWNWSEVDADAWRLAEREAKGIVAVDRLLTLRAYGRR
ncbi:hypothetical protein Cme02nite_56710 [Catellatospora methionotrophica]|uniref:Prenyltransferase/squalene oxidase-like repeat protein n=1 Tax=Catellatospora methionotrophica TaxID=121620 RepID=A0A8J3LEQ5_9ACTN|nr:hypothetical protein [Catellatospora methionotrophica]GIG17339.1 hypothetical protein Cme02nite_56710 [Catellatospora methionotrophica]